MDEFNKKRLETLKAQLSIYYKLLSEYENNNILESDPKRKLKNEREIASIQQSIGVVTKAIEELSGKTGRTSTNELKTELSDGIVDELKGVVYQIEEVKKILREHDEKISGQLSALKSEVLLKIDANAKELVLPAIEKLSDRESEWINKVFEDIDKKYSDNRLSENDPKLKTYFEKINQKIDKLSFPNKDEVKQKLNDPKQEIASKIKISLPIFFSFIKYETEFAIKTPATLENYLYHFTTGKQPKNLRFALGFLIIALAGTAAYFAFNSSGGDGETPVDPKPSKLVSFSFNYKANNDLKWKFIDSLKAEGFLYVSDTPKYQLEIISTPQLAPKPANHTAFGVDFYHLSEKVRIAVNNDTSTLSFDVLETKVVETQDIARQEFQNNLQKVIEDNFGTIYQKLKRELK
jgi:hypothetical protein